MVRLSMPVCGVSRSSNRLNKLLNNAPPHADRYRRAFGNECRGWWPVYDSREIRSVQLFNIALKACVRCLPDAPGFMIDAVLLASALPPAGIAPIVLCDELMLTAVWGLNGVAAAFGVNTAP